MNNVFEGLPDESAVTLVANCLDLAKTNNHPFRLEPFNYYYHQRALCIGLTEGENAIALFYVDLGLYAWVRRSQIHVIPKNPRICFLCPAIEVGTAYWFSPSDHGNGHYKALDMGNNTELRRTYISLHPPRIDKVNKKRKTSTQEDDGTSPTLHPIDPFSSIDDIGL